MPGSRATFTRQDRLRTRGEFQRVFRRGRRVDGPGFLLVAAANDAGRARLGLAVSRRVGSAVVRSRARRILREAFRRSRDTWPDSVDIVIVAKPGLAGRGLEEVHSELKRRLESLVKRTGRGRPGPARPD